MKVRLRPKLRTANGIQRSQPATLEGGRGEEALPWTSVRVLSRPSPARREPPVGAAMERGGRTEPGGPLHGVSSASSRSVWSCSRRCDHDPFRVERSMRGPLRRSFPSGGAGCSSSPVSPPDSSGSPVSRPGSLVGGATVIRRIPLTTCGGCRRGRVLPTTSQHCVIWGGPAPAPRRRRTLRAPLPAGSGSRSAPPRCRRGRRRDAGDRGG